MGFLRFINKMLSPNKTMHTNRHCVLHFVAPGIVGCWIHSQRPFPFGVMKVATIFGALLMSVDLTFAADVASSTNSQASLREQLFQRFLTESEQSAKAFGLSTNRDAGYTNMMRHIFDGMVVDPSFGYRWDEVPAPTMTGPDAMTAVNAFIATNGWDMQKDGVVFLSPLVPDKSKPIRGLPWTAIHDREFPAVTHDGILYVFFKGWHFNDSGVAYNPKTNAFVHRMAAFKPIGKHWYVWATSDDPWRGSQQYEGRKRQSAEPDGAANGSQPIRSETNRTSSAAGSRR